MSVRSADRVLAEYSIPQPGVHCFDSYDWDYTLSGRSPDELRSLKRLTGRDTPT